MTTSTLSNEQFTTMVSQAVAQLKAQGVLAKGDEGCFYRTQINGKQCACIIGQMMTKEQARIADDQDNASILELSKYRFDLFGNSSNPLTDFLDQFSEDQIGNLRHLQSLHDNELNLDETIESMERYIEENVKQ